ncbi:MAG TPA: hypothetical protein VLE21_04720 [Candidatus Nitrosocosmicus sp.]|nr:hypothetical protein [Candidatus Nitrosocosmicus sp.]
MPELTIDDYEELQTKANSLIGKLELLDVSEWQKKKDLIEEYIIVNRTLRDAGKLDIIKRDFCSYIITKLTERNITVNQNGNFYRMFSDDEKDPRGPKSIDQKSIEISSGKTTDEIFRDKVLSKPPKNDEITKHFDNVLSNNKECESLILALKDKYNESEELADVMIKELGDIDKLVEQDLEIASVLSLARKQIDDRNKWGNYEKLVAQFLIAVGETKAELAKKLNYCSKYASIGIERSEELTRYWHFLGNCPNCKTDVHNFFDLQIQKYLKSEELGIEVPLKGY